MRKYCGYIYKQAREQAGLTQEQASALLPIPIRTLSAYENGAICPSSELALRMIEVYGCKWLWYLHLKLNNPLGKRYLPEVQLKRLSAGVLRLQKEMSDVLKANDTVVAIACDDTISEHEACDWEKVSKEIEDLMSACVALLIAN